MIYKNEDDKKLFEDRAEDYLYALNAINEAVALINEIEDRETKALLGKLSTTKDIFRKLFLFFP